MDEQAPTPLAVLGEQPAGKHQKSGARAIRRDRFALSVVAVALVFLGWQTYSTREELRRTQVELSRQIAEGGKQTVESKLIAEQTRDGLGAAQDKLSGLGSRVDDVSGQYAAIEGMYNEFLRSRDDRSLVEIEQAINIANQQLVLASNVPAALAALQSVENQLSQLDPARFVPLRKLIARDIDRLKALPLADATEMAQQIESMIGRMDSLPLGFERQVDAKPAEVAKPATKAAKTERGVRKAIPGQAGTVQQSAVVVSVPAPESPGFFLRLAGDFWNDFRQLIRVERLDQPDPVLVSPANAAYLRENIRLRLLSARLALLQRDGKSFGEDIAQARKWLQRYFDVQSKPVADMLADLQKLEAARLNMELPSLEETAAMARSLKLGSKR